MKYDLVMVVDPRQEAKATEDKFTTLLEKEGFTILEKTPISKKILGYPLKKHTEGLYLRYVVEGDGTKPKSLLTRFRLDDTILRSLILRKEVIRVKKQKEKLKV